MALDRRRVVWYEGMTLDPHHLQQWDRYCQDLLNVRIRSLSRYDWGLTELEIDKERLANGELVLLRCSGVMPDGLNFDIPDSDAAPPPRNVAEVFPATQDRLSAFLTIPGEHQNGSNFLLQGTNNHRRETRFIAETFSTTDENTGSDVRQIEVARSNLQLRFGGEPLESYTAIQVAEILRAPGGAFVIDEQFIPTCLRVAASNQLRTMARRLVELLVAKSASLNSRWQAVFRQRELSPADVTALGLLAAVHTYLPLMSHHESGESTPEAMYQTMLALGGHLSVYASEAQVHPRTFPGYDHTDLTGCFSQLDETLRDMLGGAVPASNCIELALQESRENLYVAEVEQEILRQAQFFIVARSQKISEEHLQRDLPRVLRVASSDTTDSALRAYTIEAVLRSYTPALTIEPTSRLPVGMPVDQQATYFQLQKQGPFWDAIMSGSGIAIFMPAEFSNVDLKLVAVYQPTS